MTLAPLAVPTLLLIGLSAASCPCARWTGAAAEEIGHAQFHDSHYRHWKRPGSSVSCCSDQDCAPVKAELRHGQWYALRTEAFRPPDEEDPGGWMPLGRDEWIAVPDDTIIRVPNPTIEGGHLCYSHGAVVCFVPPNTGG